MTGKQIILLIFCVLALLTWQSCKKGCPDKNALNYMHGAKDNDGTCLYCDSSLQPLSSDFRDIEDENSQSQYAFQDVLLLYVESQGHIYSGNGCQKYNISGGSTSCIPATHDGFFINFTNSTIIFSGQLTIEYNNQQIINYNFNSVQINPLDTFKFGSFGPTCVFPDDAFFNFGIGQGYTLQYK